MSESCTHLLLFGATGDLSKRMLLPSLYNLDADSLLPDRLRIIATARSEFDTPGFVAVAAAALDQFVDAERR
ncbi:MAG: glucose-6-phosphate dehydrogenase, partial [Polymorphobacter sp.]